MEVSSEKFESVDSEPKLRSVEELEGSRKKRRRKEAPLSSFGAVVVQKKRNGSNPSRPKNGVTKEKALSDNGALGFCALGDDLVIPKKPRGVLRQKKLESGKRIPNWRVNLLHVNGASVSDEAEDKLPIEVGASSQLVAVEGIKKCTDDRAELSTDLVLASLVSDDKGKKKSTSDKTELMKDVVLSDKEKKKSNSDKTELLKDVVFGDKEEKKYASDKTELLKDVAFGDKEKKKSTSDKTALLKDVVLGDRGKKKSTNGKTFLSNKVPDGKKKKKKMKSTDGESDLLIDLASLIKASNGRRKRKSQDSDGKEKKKYADVDAEFSEAVASSSHVSASVSLTDVALSGIKRKRMSNSEKNELPSNVASPPQKSGHKRKKKSTSVADDRPGEHNSVCCRKGEKNVRHIKRNSTTLVGEEHVGNDVPLAVDRDEMCGDFLEDDLEQNAARMLSSRFDPSCTGFSGGSEPSLSRQVDAENFKSSQQESCSGDADGRMLRPRSRKNSFTRKRRHFYEVNSKDIDPYCIIKERIRVFWPLDKSWYFGLVKDYNPVTRLHHVKYDDRDEEWISLQNERFKLLLYPSEVSSKHNSGNSELELKHEECDTKSLDDSSGNCAESEPIIAWLTKSKLRRKLCSATNMIKKRRADRVKDFAPSLSLEVQDHAGANLLNVFSSPEETSPDATSVKSGSILNDKELSVVYVRKKFHRRREELDKSLEQGVQGSTAASFNILSSFSDHTVVLEENINGSSIELKLFTLALSFLGLCIHDLVFGMECSSQYALFLIQYGTLANVWPMVQMEIFLVDNVLGLRLLLFEGSLKSATVLLCLIIRSFCQHSKESKLEEMQMPFTSIGINLSGLHDKGGKLLFWLYRFLETESSKWRSVEGKLQQQCVTLREIPLHECTSSTFKNLQNESDMKLCTSVTNSAISLQNLPENSYSDTLHQIIPDKKICLNMNQSVCYIDENSGRLPRYSCSAATAPSFIIILHIKSLTEKNATSIGLLKQGSNSDQESSGDDGKLNVHSCSSIEDPSDQVSDITMENLGSTLDQVAASCRKQSVGHVKAETDAFSVSNDGNWIMSSHKVNISGNSVGPQDVELARSDETVVRTERVPSCSGSSQDPEKSSSSFPDGYSSPEKSGGVYNSNLNNTNVLPHLACQIEEKSAEKVTLAVESAMDLTWERNGYSIHSLNPIASQSAQCCNGDSTVSLQNGLHSESWQEEFMRNDFFGGSKKPRTQVSYSLPFGGYDLGSKRRSHQRKPRCYKKIASDNAKRLCGSSVTSPKFQQSLTCNANVLVTIDDKGWRECGAQVVLESDDQKDWNICVKFSGVTKFVYKAQHVLQPGITNRHTHAMMWKGGKDWTLEFTDRSQWFMFKNIHEECYNRNIRASYVKNIPIPGVRLVVDDDDDVVGVPFTRNSSKYHRQVGTEVDMALDPAHVLYDMDSDDEKWVSEMKSSVDMKVDGISEITDDMFERVMDIFEKFAFAERCEEFSSDDIGEFMDDADSNIVKVIYEYWRQKRLTKGMALIRQFQPASWVRYQGQLKKWESAMRLVPNFPDGYRENARSVKKPPMFAFCLRPRGLEVPNKLMKQRSHKKLTSMGCHSAYGRELDVFYTSGRRTNGFGDERALVRTPSYESSDSYISNDGSGLHRCNSKKSSPRNSQFTPFSQNKRSKKNGTDPWVSGIVLSANMTQIQRDGLRRHRADIDELKLRDALSAAQHASKIARMKRDKAQWLMHKADLATKKASAALIIADALKDSKEEWIDEEDF